MSLKTDDVLAIQNLAARYNFAVDDGDGEAFAACWTPDGVFDLGGTVMTGREALGAFAAEVPKRLQKPRHIASNFVIDGDGDKATLRAYVRVFVLDGEPATAVLRTQGRYSDTLERSDGQWLFATRTFTPDC